MPLFFVISVVAAILAGLVHVYIFVLESVSWTSPRVRRVFGIESDDEAQATRPLAFNQGFYNLFLAIGALLGAVLIFRGTDTTGWPLVVFSTACMLGAAVVLAGTGSRYRTSAFMQGVFPLIALVCAWLGSTFIV